MSASKKVLWRPLAEAAALAILVASSAASAQVPVIMGSGMVPGGMAPVGAPQVPAVGMAGPGGSAQLQVMPAPVFGGANSPILPTIGQAVPGAQPQGAPAPLVPTGVMPAAPVPGGLAGIANAAPPVPPEDPGQVPASQPLPELKAPSLDVLDEISATNAKVTRLKLQLQEVTLEQQIDKIRREMSAAAAKAEAPEPESENASAFPTPVQAQPAADLRRETDPRKEAEAREAAEQRTLPGVYAINGLGDKLVARLFVKNVGLVDVEAGSPVPPGFRVKSIGRTQVTLVGIQTGKSYDLALGTQPGAFQDGTDAARPAQQASPQTPQVPQLLPQLGFPQGGIMNLPPGRSLSIPLQ